MGDDAILVVVIITDEEDDHEQVGCMGTKIKSARDDFVPQG